MPVHIPNDELTEVILPSCDADWTTIGSFALTFDGYDYWGSFGRCGEIANRSLNEYEKNQKLPETLTDLRTSLFFEQRRWRHFGYAPDENAMRYIRSLVATIRQKVIAGDIR